jgi:arylsulfatase
MKLANGKMFRETSGPRGVLKCKADGKGGQTIENTGPLTKKRMETIDEETLAAAKDYIQRQAKAGKPFFCWWNATRMHFRTHVKAESLGKSGQDEYSDGMVEHDRHVGALLAALDELGIADNTIVLYSTDNGPHYNIWPDAGTTPFRSEKNSNWEGAYRVPAFVRWPGTFPAGVTVNGIMSHEDWLPTFAAAAGEPAIKDKLAKGVSLNGRQYRNYIDGYDQLAYPAGKAEQSPRNEFFYVNDDGQIVAIRSSDWKAVFLENRGVAFEVWREPFTELRVPLLFKLRRDPFERAHPNATVYNDWSLDHAFVAVPLQQIAGRFLVTMKEFPPSQTPGSFNLDKIQKQLQSAAEAGGAAAGRSRAARPSRTRHGVVTVARTFSSFSGGRRPWVSMRPRPGGVSQTTRPRAARASRWRRSAGRSGMSSMRLARPRRLPSVCSPRRRSSARIVSSSLPTPSHS